MVVGDSLKSHVWTVDKHDVIMAHLEKLFPTLVLACTVYSGVTALFSFLMVLGVKCESRCLMIPFLILSMIDIIVAGAAGVVVVVALQVQLLLGLVKAGSYDLTSNDLITVKTFLINHRHV